MSGIQLPELGSMKPAEYLRLAREIEAAGSDGFARLAVLSTFTAELLRPFIVVESYRLNCPVHPWFGPFQQLEQMVLDAGSAMWQFAPSVIWVALRLEDVDRYLPYEAAEIGPQRTMDRLDQVRQRAIGLARAVRERCGASILVSNLAAPSHARHIADASDPDGFVHLLADCNRQLARDAAQIPDVHVYDYAGTVWECGARRWTDPKLWYMARAGCSAENQIWLAHSIARSIASLLRPPAKCVVLDLDNTLWGGVLGDDGPEGIELGDDYPGNVFKDFQAALLALRRRGFLLAIASKNDEATVFEAFALHPEMLLRREHFAAIAANWESKPANLKRIAEQLNIGLDALVFIDDNPVERAQVRAELPMVHVVEMPHDPLGYLDAIKQVALLDRARLLDEDRRRSEMVQHDVQRRHIEQSAGNIDEFLQQLGMVAQVGRCDAASLERIHQLIQKTNQFNLTTRRHPLDDLRRMADSPDAMVAWLRLRDRYGELGLICVGVLRKQTDDVWEIDTFLMSCRVMGRRVEDAFLSYLAELATAAGATRLRGIYRPMPKNTPVHDFYPQRGFTVVANDVEQIYEAELRPGAFPWPQVIQCLEPREVLS